MKNDRILNVVLTIGAIVVAAGLLMQAAGCATALKWLPWIADAPVLNDGPGDPANPPMPDGVLVNPVTGPSIDGTSSELWGWTPNVPPAGHHGVPGVNKRVKIHAPSHACNVLGVTEDNGTFVLYRGNEAIVLAVEQIDDGDGNGSARPKGSWWLGPDATTAWPTGYVRVELQKDGVPVMWFAVTDASRRASGVLPR